MMYLAYGHAHPQPRVYGDEKALPEERQGEGVAQQQSRIWRRRARPNRSLAVRSAGARLKERFAFYRGP